MEAQTPPTGDSTSKPAPRPPTRDEIAAKIVTRLQDEKVPFAKVSIVDTKDATLVRIAIKIGIDKVWTCTTLDQGAEYAVFEAKRIYTGKPSPEVLAAAPDKPDVPDAVKPPEPAKPATPPRQGVRRSINKPQEQEPKDGASDPAR